MKSLDDLLEQISVMAPGCWENEQSLTLGNWWAVCNEEGIVAYFGKETDALRFRLSYINGLLNPV